MIYRVSYGFWGDFWRKIARKENQKKLGKTSPTSSVGNPRRGISYAVAWDALATATLRRRATSQHSTTPQRSNATLWRRHCSLSANFWILFRKSRICTLIVKEP